jgi:hypothetical protein
MKTAPAGSYMADITVESWGYSSDETEQIKLNALGDAVICFWDGSKWFPITNHGATLT